MVKGRAAIITIYTVAHVTAAPCQILFAVEPTNSARRKKILTAPSQEEEFVIYYNLQQ